MSMEANHFSFDRKCDSRSDLYTALYSLPGEHQHFQRVKTRQPPKRTHSLPPGHYNNHRPSSAPPLPPSPGHIPTQKLLPERPLQRKKKTKCLEKKNVLYIALIALVLVLTVVLLMIYLTRSDSCQKKLPEFQPQNCSSVLLNCQTGEVIKTTGAPETTSFQTSLSDTITVTAPIKPASTDDVTSPPDNTKSCGEGEACVKLTFQIPSPPFQCSPNNASKNLKLNDKAVFGTTDSGIRISKNVSVNVSRSGWYFIYSSLAFTFDCTSTCKGNGDTMYHKVRLYRILVNTDPTKDIKKEIFSASHSCCKGCGTSQRVSVAGGVYQAVSNDFIYFDSTRPDLINFDSPDTFVYISLLHTDNWAWDKPAS
ncbi:uncharacterized protein LOC131929726 [Physella acuta]|uniref:uncharacterized protein LOC131929726 n=1 Tax=Physella acuta TaxID=109671 RepID=UPI0027DBC616|nr:uncharacterized protein LOC131929726 [Physella acuta]